MPINFINKIRFFFSQKENEYTSPKEIRFYQLHKATLVLIILNFFLRNNTTYLFDLWFMLKIIIFTMIYSLFGSPKKKTQNPEEQAIQVRKAQQIKKVSQDLQKDSGSKLLDTEKEVQRKGAIIHHRQIIEERKKNIASKQKVSAEQKLEKKKYLPSAQKAELFFDPFSKGGNPKYSLNRNDKQKTQPNAKEEALKPETKQSSLEAKNVQKTIASSSVEQKAEKKGEAIVKNEKVVSKKDEKKVEIAETPKKRALTVVEEVTKKSDEVNTPSQQKQEYSSIYSKNKQNIYTPNPKIQQKQENQQIVTEQKLNIKTPSKSVKQVGFSQASAQVQKSQTQSKFKRTAEVKSIQQKPKVSQVKDKNQKFIKTPANIKPIEIVTPKKEDAKPVATSPKYSETVKKLEQAKYETPKPEAKNNQQDNVPRLWNTTKSNYKNAYFNRQSKVSQKQPETIKIEEKKTPRQGMNSPKATIKQQKEKVVKTPNKQENQAANASTGKKQQKQIELFSDHFRKDKRQTRSPIFNATSPRNQEKQKSQSKKDQTLNKSCDKQLKRQNEANALKNQIQQKRKKEQALRQEQARKKSQKLALENLKRQQEAEALKAQLEQRKLKQQSQREQAIRKRKQQVQKRNVKPVAVQVQDKSITSQVVQNQKNVDTNSQNLYQRKSNVATISSAKSTEKLQQTRKEVLLSPKSENFAKSVEKPIEKSIIQNKKEQVKVKPIITKNADKKGAQEATSDRKNPEQSARSNKKQAQASIEKKQISVSQVSPFKKRHDHQYREGSLRKSVQRESVQGSSVKDIVAKERLIQLKHSRNESVTKQEYDELIEKISHLQQYLEKNEEELTAAHNDIIRKKQMLEDARQQIVDKNRLILELKYQQGPDNAIMPERFHYWSLQSNVFYKSRDPVGQIVQQRRRAARESRIVNQEILSHSHYRLHEASRVSLREQTNSNQLRNAKSEGAFKLNFSQGHPQQEKSIEASRLSSQRSNGQENSQFYIGLLQRLKSRVSILKRQNQALQRGLIIR